MKSKATRCGSISTVFSSMVLLCASSIITIRTTTMNAETIRMDGNREKCLESNQKSNEEMENMPGGQTW